MLVKETCKQCGGKLTVDEPMHDKPICYKCGIEWNLKRFKVEYQNKWYPVNK